MLGAGPSPDEGIAAYNGPILRERIEERFEKVYSPAGVYKLLHRLRYNDRMPRPRHSDTDPAALAAFKTELPERLARLRARHPDKRVLSYCQNEARFGQHGTLTRVDEDRLVAAGDSPDAVRLHVRVQRRMPPDR